MTKDRQQLEQAIAKLDAQRAILGDEVVDPAVAGILQQLDELLAQESPDKQRKLVTILFADIVGSTKIGQHLDPEDVMAVMDDGLQRLAIPVGEHGGHVTRFMGDGFMAVLALQ